VGSGLDTLLTALREAIALHGKDGFPVEQLRPVMGAWQVAELRASGR
jgi:hypothetical protein